MKKKEESCAYLIAVLLTGLAFGIVAGVIGLSLFYPTFQSDEWAAWVQAFGSIGAVVAAVIIAKHQSEKSREMLKDQLTQEETLVEAKNKLLISSINERMRTIIDEAQVICSGLASSKDVFNVIKRKEIVVELLVGELNAIPLNEYPATVLAPSVLKLKIQVNRLKEEMEQYGRSTYQTLDVAKVIRIRRELERLEALFV